MKWALLWAVLIFILCMIPGRDLPKISWLDFFGVDKLVHAALFFVLVILIIGGFAKQETNRLLIRYPKMVPLLIGILYGGSLELLQGALFIERTADVYDFLANTSGSVLGAILFKPVNERIISKFIR